MKDFIQKHAITLITILISTLVAYHVYYLSARSNAEGLQTTINLLESSKKELQGRIILLESKVEEQNDVGNKVASDIEQLGRDLIDQEQLFVAQKLGEQAIKYFPDSNRIQQLNRDIQKIVSEEYNGPLDGALNSIPEQLPDYLRAKGYFYMVEYWFPAHSNRTIRYFGYEKPDIDYNIASGHWFFESERIVAIETCKIFEERNKRNNALYMYKYGKGFEAFDGLIVDKWIK